MISVIIPSYNRGQIIIKSIESVLKQTYKDFELIIVDDGSIDNTKEVILAIPDKRIKYIKQTPNQGACVARNRGIAEARGEYIAFQDSDDIWVRDKLEKQLKFIQSKKADMAYCGMIRCFDKKQTYFPNDQKPTEKLTLESLLKKNKISTQNIIIKTSVARSIMFDPSFKRLQDWDFTTRVLLNGYKVEYQAEALVRAQVQKDSITSRVKTVEAYEHFLAKYSNEYEKFPKSKAGVYYTIGTLVQKTDPKTSKIYLKKSMKINNNIKTFLRYLLCYVR